MSSLVLLIAVALTAHLQPPSPTPTESGQKKQTESAGEKQVAAKNDGPNDAGPSPLAQHKNQVDTADSGNQSEKNEKDAATDWNRVVAFGTIALAIFALVQVVV